MINVQPLARQSDLLWHLQQSHYVRQFSVKLPMHQVTARRGAPHIAELIVEEVSSLPVSFVHVPQ